MWYKGIKFKRANHLGWRNGDPERDLEGDGTPLQRNYVCIVRIKDCRLYTEGGRDYYDAKDAPQYKALAMTRTNMGYGKPRNYTPWMGEPYQTIPAYLVYDGQVYQGRLRARKRDE